MAKLIRPSKVNKKKVINGYSPFCNEMVNVCSRRQFLYLKDKLGPAHWWPSTSSIAILLRYGRYPPSWSTEFAPSFHCGNGTRGHDWWPSTLSVVLLLRYSRYPPSWSTEFAPSFHCGNGTRGHDWWPSISSIAILLRYSRDPPSWSTEFDPSFHCGNGTCTVVLRDGRTGRAAITETKKQSPNTGARANNTLYK